MGSVFAVPSAAWAGRIVAGAGGSAIGGAMLTGRGAASVTTTGGSAAAGGAFFFLAAMMALRWRSSGSFGQFATGGAAFDAVVGGGRSRLGGTTSGDRSR